jgi:hypothetical protein
MNKRAPLILFTIVLGILGIVALFFWNAIRHALIAPISALILLAFDFLSSFDQIYLWGFLLFVLILVTINRLGKSTSTELPARIANVKVTSSGRFRFWEIQVFLLTRTRIPSRYSIHEVRRLLVAVMGYKMHLNPDETDRRLKSGELEIPAQYVTFADLDQDSEEPDDFLTILIKTLVSILKGKRQQAIQAREKVLSDLIHFMETQLEIEHDH